MPLVYSGGADKKGGKQDQSREGSGSHSRALLSWLPLWAVGTSFCRNTMSMRPLAQNHPKQRVRNCSICGPVPGKSFIENHSLGAQLWGAGGAGTEPLQPGDVGCRWKRAGVPPTAPWTMSKVLTASTLSCQPVPLGRSAPLSLLPCQPIPHQRLFHHSCRIQCVRHFCHFLSIIVFCCNPGALFFKYSCLGNPMGLRSLAAIA